MWSPTGDLLPKQHSPIKGIVWLLMEESSRVSTDTSTFPNSWPPCAVIISSDQRLPLHDPECFTNLELWYCCTVYKGRAMCFSINSNTPMSEVEAGTQMFVEPSVANLRP